MLRQKSAHTSALTHVVPVLDTEALRRTALAASWQRDRRVGRRRLVLRWLGWALWRYLLPALLLAGLCALLWLYLVPMLHAEIELKHASAKERAPAVESPSPTASPAIPSASTNDMTAAPPDFATGPSWPDPGPATAIQLKFDAGYTPPQAQSPSAQKPATTSTEDASVIQPQLKPENWLHSKEP